MDETEDRDKSPKKRKRYYLPRKTEKKLLKNTEQRSGAILLNANENV